MRRSVKVGAVFTPGAGGHVATLVVRDKIWHYPQVNSRPEQHRGVLAKVTYSFSVATLEAGKGAKLAKFTLNDTGQGAGDDLELDLEDDMDPDAEDDVCPDDDAYPDDDLDAYPDDDPDAPEEEWAGEDRSKPVAPAPGCAVSFFLDNKRHHAICLAVINDELLLEHKGASRCFLFIGKVIEIVPRIRRGVASATITIGVLKPCRYRAVPKKWLQEMVRNGLSWKGMEGGGKLAPPPGELLRGQMELF